MIGCSRIVPVLSLLGEETGQGREPLCGEEAAVTPNVEEGENTATPLSPLRGRRIETSP